MLFPLKNCIINVLINLVEFELQLKLWSIYHPPEKLGLGLGLGLGLLGLLGLP